MYLYIGSYIYSATGQGAEHCKIMYLIAAEKLGLVLWIQIHHFKGIRIRIHLFLIKNCYLLIPGPPQSTSFVVQATGETFST
jgi:hypothetical protein